MSFFNFFQKGIQIADSLLLFEPTWHSPVQEPPSPPEATADDFSNKQFLQNIYSQQPLSAQEAPQPSAPAQETPPLSAIPSYVVQAAPRSSDTPAYAFSEPPLAESAADMTPHPPDMTPHPPVSKLTIPQLVSRKHRFFFQDGQ